MLEYSVYIHIIGAALVFAIVVLLSSVFHLDSHLSELPGKKPAQFLDLYFVEGTLLFLLYPIYVVIAAILIGAYNLPNLVANNIVKYAGFLTRQLTRIPGLKWVQSPSPDYPVEPIWYNAFHVATNGFVETKPLLMVKMKSGDIYYGQLKSYPILPDSQKEKRFPYRKSYLRAC